MIWRSKTRRQQWLESEKHSNIRNMTKTIWRPTIKRPQQPKGGRHSSARNTTKRIWGPRTRKPWWAWSLAKCNKTRLNANKTFHYHLQNAPSKPWKEEEEKDKIHIKIDKRKKFHWRWWWRKPTWMCTTNCTQWLISQKSKEKYYHAKLGMPNLRCYKHGITKKN